MARITIDSDSARAVATNDEYYALETGDILYLPTTPFLPAEEVRSLLISQRQAGGALHKNISYRPSEDRLKGIEIQDNETRKRVHGAVRDYSRGALEFLARFLPHYAKEWRVDFASFRPNEEQGRRISWRSRNDLIHVDSFPSRPSSGDRILRIFTNLHPNRPRVWVTSSHFESLALAHARPAGLTMLKPDSPSSMARRGKRFLAKAGLPLIDRPEYDRFMLRFHHYLKESAWFQQNCPKDLWHFPPGSSWMVFTDASSHSCISGQFAMEQTVIVKRRSLVHPDKAPISILEKMAGFRLAPAVA